MNKTKKRYSIAYIILWLIGSLFFFPIFIFLSWRKKIVKSNTDIFYIKQEMTQICKIYHQKYITFLQEIIKNQLNNQNENIFAINASKYLKFKLEVSNLNSFLKLHKNVCDHLLYSPESSISTTSQKELARLNDGFNDKIAIYALLINSKIIKKSYQYKKWPKNIFYSHLTKDEWIVWY